LPFPARARTRSSIAGGRSIPSPSVITLYLLTESYYDMSLKSKLVIVLAMVALVYLFVSSGGEPVEVDLDE
jgi:hypothetical protein